MSDVISVLKDNIIILIPLLIIQLGLLVAALIHIFKHDSYRMGNRVIWVVVVIAVSTIGSLAYFLLGSKNDSDYGDDSDE